MILLTIFAIVILVIICSICYRVGYKKGYNDAMGFEEKQSVKFSDDISAGAAAYALKRMIRKNDGDDWET